LASNLTAIFAFYVYVIWGWILIHSHCVAGSLFSKALYIVNNALRAQMFRAEAIRQYATGTGLRSDQFKIPSFMMHSMIISAKVDRCMIKRPTRQGVLSCLSILNTINTDNPNLMIIQFFLGRA
jgi:hypothetical protein